MEFFEKNRKIFVYLSMVFIVIFGVMFTTNQVSPKNEAQSNDHFLEK